MKRGRVAVGVVSVLAIAALLPGCKWAFHKVVETLRYVARYDSGVPRKEGSLRGGEQTGKWTFYYEDGRKRAEGDYEDDHQVGAWTSWYENGRVEWTGRFDERGARAGLWTFWHDNGELRAQGRYRNDLEQGRWSFRDKQGRLQRVGDYLDARMVGWWSHRAADGSVTAEGLVYDGERTGPWRLQEQGTPSDATYPVPDGLALVRETWPDGGVRRTGLQRGDTKVGGWATLHSGPAPAPGAGAPLRMSAVFEDGAATAFFAADDGRAEVAFAEGVLAGTDLVDWRASGDDRDRTPLPMLPPAGGDWSAAELPKDTAADTVVATWLAELRAPAKALPPAAAAATAAPAPTEDPRVAAPMQPEWTVMESTELQEHVQQYLKGSRRKAASMDRYAIPKAMQGKPRRREDLEGQPFPVERLQATDGTEVELASFHGEKRVLFVVLRGFFGQVCVYCVAQTEALAQCHDRFDALNMEVLILYPGPAGNEQAFVQAYEETFGKGAPPYRVFYDPDLAITRQLGIEGGDLAYPTTIFVDEQGVVRYAYTGAHRADRPAAEQLLEFIQKLDAK
ncbi:MAG: redoxin family protein [Planctomycetota bacterium]